LRDVVGGWTDKRHGAKAKDATLAPFVVSPAIKGHLACGGGIGMVGPAFTFVLIFIASSFRLRNPSIEESANGGAKDIM
jgi:hypothetical protein